MLLLLLLMAPDTIAFSSDVEGGASLWQGSSNFPLRMLTHSPRHHLAKEEEEEKDDGEKTIWNFE